MNYDDKPTQTASKIVFAEAEDSEYAGSHMMARPEFEVQMADLTPEQQGMIHEASKHILAGDIVKFKFMKTAQGMLQLNVYMGEQFAEAMLAHDITEARVLNRACHSNVKAFLDKRRIRPHRYLDIAEEHAATRTIQEAGRLPYPKKKVQESKWNLIFRMFTSEKTKNQIAADKDDRLPMSSGTPFGLPE